MRHSKKVTIQDKGRDHGKTFLLTEMSARQAERWATKALVAVVNSGMQIPDEKMHLGMAAVAEIGADAMMRHIDFVIIEELMDEMFACIQIVEPKIVRTLVDDDIEEVKTRLILKAEVFELHTGFSVSGRLSTLLSALNPPGSSLTQTSQP